jgi:DEAD/DEAH box helicase domain-containing protein
VSAPPERTGPVVVFDVETQNLFEHVGGPRNAHKLLVSVAVSYDVDTGEYRVFTHETAPQLVDQLFGARLVVGYNTIKFDYRVLRPYTDRRLNQLPTLDIFDHLYRRTNFRSRLDTVASETLGERKSGHGLEAYEWWTCGEVQKCIDYCREDVRLTYEVYKYGKENGAVFTRDPRGRRTRVAVMW